jgi:hypothetical protein
MARGKSGRISRTAIRRSAVLAMVLVLVGASIALANDNGSSRFTLFGAARIEGEQPTATQPTSTEPTATQPTTTEPTATQPTSTEPTTTEPTSTEPTTTEPTSTEPTTTEPTSTDSSGDQAQPSVRGPRTSPSDAGDHDQQSQDGSGGHDVVVRIDTRKGESFGGLQRKLGGGVDVGSLDGGLKLDYYLDSAACGTGTPRITLRVDENNNGSVDGSDGYAFGYFGKPPNFTHCQRNAWQTLDFTRGSDQRWDLSQLGGPAYADWDKVKAFIGDRRVLTASVVNDDSQPGARGTLLLDNVTLGERAFTDSL